MKHVSTADDDSSSSSRPSKLTSSQGEWRAFAPDVSSAKTFREELARREEITVDGRLGCDVKTLKSVYFDYFICDNNGRYNGNQ